MELEDNDVLWSAYPVRKRRRWFVLKLRGFFPVDQIEAKITQARDTIIAPILDDADTVFKPEFDLTPTPGVAGRGWTGAQDKELRAEILYGLLGLHPEFFSPGHLAYLYHIARRRYRIVIRMMRFVDEEGQFFEYPDDDGTVAGYKLNDASQLHWEKKNENGNERYPFILSPEGRFHPQLAIDVLFTAFADAEDRNQLGCEAVAVAIQLDSLQAVKDPASLLAAMIAQGPDYVRIDHPAGSRVYLANGQSTVVGYITVTRAAPRGSVSLQIESTLANPLAEFVVTTTVRTEAGTGAKLLNMGPSNPFHLVIEDGVRPPVSAPRNNVVAVTGMYIDPASLGVGDAVNAGTRFTNWIEVQLLPRDILAGTRLTLIAAPASHFLTEPWPTRGLFPGQPTPPPNRLSLFESVLVAREDLIPGDHLVLPNHPLYRSIGEGMWQAEHAFVTRLSGPDGGLQVFGHGLSGTLTGVAAQLLKELNDHLALIAEVTRIHVGGIGRASTEAFCADIGGNEIACASPAAIVNLPNGKFHYFPFKYHEKEGPPHAIQKIPHGRNQGEVEYYNLNDPVGVALFETKKNPDGSANSDALTIIQPAGAYAFAFWYEGKLQFVFREQADSDDLPNWKFEYVDPRFVFRQNHQLFRRDLPGVDDAFTQWFNYSHLHDLFPIYNDETVQRIAVIRPRVNFDPLYQTMLENVGAL